MRLNAAYSRNSISNEIRKTSRARGNLRSTYPINAGRWRSAAASFLRSFKTASCPTGGTTGLTATEFVELEAGISFTSEKRAAFLLHEVQIHAAPKNGRLPGRLKAGN